MRINVNDILNISFSIFFLGFFGAFVIKKNLIQILLSIELILLSANINIIIFSVYLDDLLGQVFGLIIFTIAAAETAIGLAIIVAYYRFFGSVNINTLNQLKGFTVLG